MGEVGEKRKHPVEKKVVIFVNSELGDRCAALFEFKIQITKTSVSGEVETDSAKEDVVLKPISYFYHRRLHPEINSVAACCASNVVYVMPDDLELGIVYNPDKFCTDEYLELIFKPRDILPLCTFDLKTYKKQTLSDLLPHTRKPSPILAAVDNTTSCVFALSGFKNPVHNVLDPCFESLDLTNNNKKWSPLACPSFHIPLERPFHEQPFHVVGHVVLLDYILVSFTQLCSLLKTMRFYSYNIPSTTWKPALLHRPDLVVSHDIDAPRILGEAVSIANNIYAFNNRWLYVFSYTHLYNQTGSGAHDLALGSATLVEGVKFNEEFVYTDWDVPYTFSCTIAKVDDDTLCLLHSIPPTCLELQCVWVTFIQLKKRDLCDTLKTFKCTLSSGEILVNPTIKTCFVLDQDETSDRGKRAAM